MSITPVKILLSALVIIGGPLTQTVSAQTDQSPPMQSPPPNPQSPLSPGTVTDQRTPLESLGFVNCSRYLDLERFDTPNRAAQLAAMNAAGSILARCNQVAEEQLKTLETNLAVAQLLTGRSEEPTTPTRPQKQQTQPEPKDDPAEEDREPENRARLVAVSGLDDDLFARLSLDDIFYKRREGEQLPNGHTVASISPNSVSLRTGDGNTYIAQPVTIDRDSS